MSTKLRETINRGNNMDYHFPSTASRILQVAVIVLTVITVVIHFFIGITYLSEPNVLVFAILFILNSAGFTVLLAGLFTRLVPILSSNRALAHYTMMAFAAVTILAYVFVSGILSGEPSNPIAIAALIDESLLILATYLHLKAL